MVTTSHKRGAKQCRHIISPVQLRASLKLWKNKKGLRYVGIAGIPSTKWFLLAITKGADWIILTSNAWVYLIGDIPNLTIPWPPLCLLLSRQLLEQPGELSLPGVPSEWMGCPWPSTTLVCVPTHSRPGFTHFLKEHSQTEVVMTDTVTHHDTADLVSLLMRVCLIPQKIQRT